MLIYTISFILPCNLARSVGVSSITHEGIAHYKESSVTSSSSLGLFHAQFHTMTTQVTKGLQGIF